MMSSDPQIVSIVLLSLKVSLVAVICTLPFAIACAYVLAKGRFQGKALLSALVHLPLVMPPVVTGYLLLLTFGRRGFVGSHLESLGLGFSFSWVGAALAAGVMAFPLLVRPIRLAFETQDSKFYDMAATLGASRWRRFRTIALPLAVPGIIAGAVLGFAKALGEFGATITFVSNIPDETRTLSLAIYTFLQSPTGGDSAMTLVIVSIAISFVAIFASEIVMSALERRRERS